MVFFTLEDETGFINVAIPPRDYDRLRKTIAAEPFLLVEGKLQRDQMATSILLNRAWPLQVDLQVESRNFHWMQKGDSYPFSGS